MSGSWGNNYKISIFGESHGEAVGVIIDGIPAGFAINEEELAQQMERRAPGRDSFSTTRNEPDKVKIVSGYFNGRATGTPLCAMVTNTAQRSADYLKAPKMARPGHADYTGMVKYSGYQDFRGGGHFSGRITLALVIAGSIARQYLRQQGIIIGSHISSICGIDDGKMDAVNDDIQQLEDLSIKRFPVISSDSAERMKVAILNAKSKLDSLGGIIECKTVGLKAGIGDPYFDSLESSISHLAFSVPAVKGIEFGAGFEIASMTGSEANDRILIKAGQVSTKTNNNGGINGGISNGMPMLFRVAIKPTASISQEQKSINIEDYTENDFIIKGRHDPCIVQRAIPVIESITAIAIMESFAKLG